MTSHYTNNNFHFFVDITKATLFLKRYPQMTSHQLYQQLTFTLPIQKVFARVIIPNDEYRQKMHNYNNRMHMKVVDINTSCIVDYAYYYNVVDHNEQIIANNTQQPLLPVPQVAPLQRRIIDNPVVQPTNFNNLLNNNINPPTNQWMINTYNVFIPLPSLQQNLYD